MQEGDIFRLPLGRELLQAREAADEFQHGMFLVLQE